MASVENVSATFSQWARQVQHATSNTQELYEGGGHSHPFSSTACIDSCCSLLGVIDKHHHLYVDCCRELLSTGVFTMLGEGTATDWDGISKGLAHRVGTQLHDPAWLQSDPEQCQASVSERLQRACCSGEVAVLMLRLAVRTACLASSWYGPWDSLAALQDLVEADAWTSLQRALRALLTIFGAGLVKQYNAINIVGDILHVGSALLSVFS